MELVHRFHDLWRARSVLVAKDDYRTRLTLIEHAIAEWLDPERRSLRLLLELTVSRIQQSELTNQLSHWHRTEQKFWTDMMLGNELAGEILSTFALDEGLFNIGLYDVANYRYLRSMCLRRLLDEIWNINTCSESELKLFDNLIVDLKPDKTFPLNLSNVFPEKKVSIARCAGHLLADHGFSEITHRAVSKASGIPISTVAYYCPHQKDLLLAGLYGIIHEFQSWNSVQPSDINGPPNKRIQAILDNTNRLVRCTGMIGLACRKHRELVPAACDMRRRRGENFSTAQLRSVLPSCPETIDPIIAQAFSCCTFGSRLRAASMAESEADAIHRLLAFFDRGEQRGGPRNDL